MERAKVGFQEISRALVVLLCVAAGTSAAATAQDVASQVADTTSLKPNPMLALREFEPAGNGEYEIGAGDELMLDFGGRTELTAKKARDLYKSALRKKNYGF